MDERVTSPNLVRTFVTCTPFVMIRLPYSPAHTGAQFWTSALSVMELPMGRLKEAMLAQATSAKPDAKRTTVKGDPYDDPTDSKPPRYIRSAKLAPDRTPIRFTYALKAYTVEIRTDGWWITKTWLVSRNERPQWVGPFASIEDACLAIARRLATEIADRHSVIAAFHKLKPGQPLHGMKPTTRLSQRKTTKT